MKRILLLGVAQCTVIGALTAPVVVGLSIMVTRMVGAAQAPGALSIVIAAGSAAAMVANPLLGWCADITPRRFGGRRSWLVGGALVGLGGSLAVSAALDVAPLLAAWVIAQVGYNACFGSINGLLSQDLAADHRVRAGAVFTAAGFVGTLPGLAVAALLPHDIIAMTMVMPTVATVVLIGIGIGWRGAHQTRPRRITRARWVAVRAVLSRRLLGAVAIRFIFAVELAAGLIFGLYLFVDRWMLPEPDAVRLVSSSTLTGAVGVVLVAIVVAGCKWSGGTGRMLSIAVVGLAAASAGRALAPEPVLFHVATFVAGCTIGLAFTATRAVAQAELPPDQSALGLGVFNIANTLAPVVAPLLAAGLLAVGAVVPDAYAVMYLLLGALVLLVLPLLLLLRQSSARRLAPEQLAMGDEEPAIG